MHNSDLMDQATIESLRSVLEDGINELFEEFIKDCPAAIDRLARAIADNDMDEINQAAHYLKGSGGNIGAIAFSNACKALEQQAKDNSLVDAEAQLVQIRELFDATTNYMKNQFS